MVRSCFLHSCYLVAARFILRNAAVDRKCSKTQPKFSQVGRICLRADCTWVCHPEWLGDVEAKIAGCWREAANAWKARGCPYEQGRALIDGDSGAQHEALEIFERLSARPIAEWLRTHMREEGIRGVPRGPRQATRDNPAGLTAREMQVLLLVAEGCSNGEIADRLSRSLRTVDHHLAAILAKLDAA